ncbi:hypothetical protein QBL02_02415 [Leucobacter sp. UT-8R-CII-1-4]|uniref:hypothetical protein n=1 Tax=Leucobacter sp. UT-8R-CII-1-4 TaxID=3040075 RepID=UPI0024A7C0C4|nr:hypothetical protein [Leucobacter sp. UT-8R-CII-1-4]MDI6022397.1 hypothetical protein [Leucobacter sp. UT-8R-CII-1-4]
MLLIAILLAAIGAVGLSVGTHLQHRAVQLDVGLRKSGVSRAFTRPLWIVGLAILALQTLLNLVALGLAPVAVVQPVGALALVSAVVISAFALGVPIRRGLLVGIALSVFSIAGFVAISAGYVQSVRPDAAAASMLAWLLLCLVLLGLLVAHRCRGHLARVTAAGVIFGAVAAAAHLVSVELLARLQGFRAGSFHVERIGEVAQRELGGVTSPSDTQLWQLGAVLVVAAVVGMWLVQTAYASGPPETVLASLTVLDPMVAVLIGAVLLGEYGALTPLAAFGLFVCGSTACFGIGLIAQHHPGLAQRDAPVNIGVRSSAAPQNRRS